MATGGLSRWAAAIQQFGHPCFTYILKLKTPSMQDMQKGFYLLCGGLQWDSIRQLEQLDSSVDGGHQIACILEEISPGDGHLQALAWAGYRAAMDVMRRKQYCGSPSCSIWSQSEIGETGWHVHVVIGGPGLGRHNATASRNLLAIGFFKYLLLTIRERMQPGHPALTPCEHTAWNWIQEIARLVMMNETGEVVDILKSRNNAGALHAQGINGSQFIVRYLLPKNRKLALEICAATTTPEDAFHPGWDGTYGYAVCNGLTVPEHIRYDLWKALYDTYSDHPAEQMLAPDVTMWRGLPTVSTNQIDSVDAASVPKPIKLSKKHRVMMDLIQRATTKLLLTYNDLVEHTPDLLLMLEGMAGGSKTVEQLLTMIHIRLCQKYNALDFLFLRTPISPGFNINFSSPYKCGNNLVFRLLNTQGYNAWQVGHWLNLVLAKKAGKRNSVLFFGPASTGKTNLAKALCHSVGLYGCVNHNNKQFPFNDAPNKLIVWWEECIMTTDYVEAAKCILGGTDVRIDVKHKDSRELGQVPVILSSNHDVYTVQGGNVTYGVHATPLKERITQLNFMKQLENTFGEITKQMVVDWLYACKMYTPGQDTLDGFVYKWKLDGICNSFPVQKLCPGHSQSWTFHDNGVCWNCGGFYQSSEVRSDDDGDADSDTSGSDSDGDRDSDPGELDLDSDSGIGFGSVVSSAPSVPDVDLGPVEENCESLEWMRNIIESMSAHEINRAADSAMPFILDPIVEEPEEEETERSVADENGQPEPSENNSAVAKRSREEDTDEDAVSDEHERFLSQPVTSSDWDEYLTWRERCKRRRLEREAGEGEPMETREESESDKENQPDPSAWGERLGVFRSVGFSEPPIVLHCFETLEDSDTD